jgi:hypothetical protein
MVLTDVALCFRPIGHDRRKILHFNVTRNPNTLWVGQQLREAWAYKQPVIRQTTMPKSVV